MEVFTHEIIESTWRVAHCWPIDRSIPSQLLPTMSISSDVSALDTPARLCKLSQMLAEKARWNDDDELKGLVHELIDFTAEKVMKFRDIALHMETLSKLQDRKIRKPRKRSRHIGEAHVLIY